MNVSEALTSTRSIGLSRRAAAVVTGSTSTTSSSPSGSRVRVLFVGESDMSVLLIRCLESELYAAIVALSTIILESRPILVRRFEKVLLLVRRRTGGYLPAAQGLACPFQRWIKPARRPKRALWS